MNIGVKQCSLGCVVFFFGAFFLSIRGVAQFLHCNHISVDSSNRGLDFHFIKLFIMTVDMG